MSANIFKSSRLFLYFGFGLVLLALACVPVEVKVAVGPETELLHLGPIIALLVGVWIFPSLLLGIAESSISRRAVLSCFTLILCLANVLLALSTWDAVRFWRGILDRWLISYSPLIAPCMIADVVAFLYLAQRERLSEALENTKIRVILIIAFAASPLMILVGVLYAWLAAV